VLAKKGGEVVFLHKEKSLPHKKKIRIAKMSQPQTGKVITKKRFKRGNEGRGVGTSTIESAA